MHRISNILGLFRELWALPRVEICIGGGEKCIDFYRYFTQMHPRYRVIRNKVWGVALLALPDTFEEYLRGKDKQALRTNRKHALAQGYYCDQFLPTEHLSEILAVNRSKPARQGVPWIEVTLKSKKLFLPSIRRLLCLEFLTQRVGSRGTFTYSSAARWLSFSEYSGMVTI